MNRFAFSDSSLRRLETCDPRIQEIMNIAIQHSPLDFGIPSLGGKRTADEQNKLFLDGVSKCDGHRHLSYHQSGMAVDIYAYVDGKASWDETYLSVIAGHVLGVAKGLNYELEWGGFFKNFLDMPHFQLRYT